MSILFFHASIFFLNFITGKSWETVELRVVFNSADGGQSYHGYEESSVFNASTSVRRIKGPFCVTAIQSAVDAYSRLDISINVSVSALC